MYVTLLRNRNLRYYFTGGAVSRFGDILSGLAFLFLAYDLTGTARHTTVMAIAETMPYLFFGLAGGAIADWVQKKRLLIILDLIRMPIVLSIVVLASFDILSFTYLLLISFLIQSIGCFFNPAHRALLPQLVKEAELSAANSLWDTIVRCVTVLTPIAAAGLLHYFHTPSFFMFDAISYGCSAILISFLQIKETINAKGSVKKVFTAIGTFLRWMRQSQTISVLFLTTFLVVFFNTWVWQVGVLLALEGLTAHSEQQYSFIQSIFGASAAVISILLPYLLKQLSMKIYFIGSFIWGIGILFYGFFYSLPAFFIGVVITGIGMPISSLTRVYLLQSLVPKAMLGRAFSTNAVLLYLSNTLSLAIFAFILPYTTIQLLMIFSGSCIVVFSFVYFFSMRWRARKAEGVQP